MSGERSEMSLANREATIIRPASWQR